MYYKFVHQSGGSLSRGTGFWSMPQDGQPGEWREVSGRLVVCRNGLHVCREQDISSWLACGLLCEAEVTGDQIVHDDKVVVRRARLTRVVGTVQVPLLVRYVEWLAGQPTDSNAMS